MNAIREARYNLGIAYLDVAQYKEAIHEFEAVIQLDADCVDAYCGLSCAYLELNELDKAETSALAALSIHSDYPSALSLVDAVKNSRYDNGITYLNDERYYEAVSTFQKIATLDPDFKQVYYNLGRSYIGLKEFGKAIDSFKSAIDSDAALEDVHYHISCAYVEQKQFGKAIPHLEQAITIDPNLKEAHDLLASAYRESGNLEASTNTLKLYPDHQPARDLAETIRQKHYNRGIAYLNDKRYSNAVDAFQNVLTLDPDFTEAHFNLGIAYLKMETYPRAIEALKKTVTLDHTHKAAYHALALAYFGRHELEEARHAAQEALKIDSKYPPALSLLETIDPNFSHSPIPPSTETQDAVTQPKIDTGEDQFIEKSEQASLIENESQSAEAEKGTQESPDIKMDLERGLTFLNNQLYKQAAAAYKRAINTDPNCIDAHYGLGEAYLGIGAFDDAKTAAGAALKLDPHHHSSRELLQKIKDTVNLERKQKKQMKVILYTLIVAIIALGIFIVYRFEVIAIPGFFTPNNDTKNSVKGNHNQQPLPSEILIKASLEEPSGNGFIDAGETAHLKLIISNKGSSPVSDFKIAFKPKSIRGLRFKMPTETFKLSKNGSKTVKIEMKADKTAQALGTSLEIQLVGEDGILLKTQKFDFKIM